MVMHCATYADSPAHVIEGLQFTHQLPLDLYYGTGVMVVIPKKQWELTTAKDLENAMPNIQNGLPAELVHGRWFHRAASGANRRAGTEPGAAEGLQVRCRLRW